MHAIEVRQLSKRFGALTAVNGVSFTVERGEVLGFLGPNGAGKSTTMKMIAGFLEPSSGIARVYGHDVMEEPIEAKRKLGYLPEGAPLYAEMTPRGFLGFIAEVRGLKGKAAQDRIAEVVSKVHLEGVMGQRIETLSKGYKRRVGLAQALLHDPEVLILDEPTDGLDPNQKHEVRALIKDMARDKAIIISTHILEEVDAVCTRAIIIGRGRVLFSGTPAELAARSEYHNAVGLVLKTGVVQAAKRRIEGLSVVARVEEEQAADGHARLLAVPKNGASILAEVAEAVHAGDWEVDGLEVESGRLDEVFRTITAQYRDRSGADSQVP
jgi:ABC-2 type transport system ATP-binding protein